MPRAIWNGQVIAESAVTQRVEGNHYFPPSAIRREFFEESDTQSVCGWKGTAHYYSVVVDGQKNTDAAWYYPDPKPQADSIRDHIAFWKGVAIEETPGDDVVDNESSGACEI